jgi:GMP reductase
MLGGMLAGHDECEGQWVEVGGQKRRFRFYGMSSRDAIEKYSGGMGGYRAAEGRAVEVPYRGPVTETLREITGGLRSACAYVGAESLKALPKCCTFIRVNRTQASMFDEK